MRLRILALGLLLPLAACSNPSTQSRVPTEDPREIVPNKIGKADGFNWGGECTGGNGSFTQRVERNTVVAVGTIPVGKANVEITLVADADVDVQLYAADGTKVVHWPDGLLKEAGPGTATYAGLSVSWSGFEGIGGNPGHEKITLEGVTDQEFVMKAFGYAAGQAQIDYKWDAKPGCTATVSDSGSGSFSQAIAHREVVTIGEIPAGLKNIEIKLNSSVDVDVQLIAADGTKVVHWSEGLLRGETATSASYDGVVIHWSGYAGDGSGAGNESIRIEGTTASALTMKAFGYEAGSATVNYSWGNDWTGTGGYKTFPERVAAFAAKYPTMVTQATKQGRPAIFLKTTKLVEATAPDEDAIRAFYADYYAMLGTHTAMAWNPAGENYFHLWTPSGSQLSPRFRNVSMRLYSHFHVWNVALGNLDNECYDEDDDYDDEDATSDFVDSECLSEGDVGNERTVALLKMDSDQLTSLNTYLEAIDDDFYGTLGQVEFNGGTPPYLGGGEDGQHNCTSWFSIWANQSLSSALPMYANPASLIRAYTQGSYSGTLATPLRALVVFNHPDPPAEGADLDRNFPIEVGH
jgi:hypothetical protein